ncbi:MAG TPA: rhodanese-like domain-containing protein [Myxococcales bacterium]|nr:rhodanese-like domain-containing protein [Myxococcales bacterium]
MTIEPKALQEKLAGPNPPLLVDVRMPHEAQMFGSIEGGKLIPMNDLPMRVGELPEDREVVLYCKSGMRSGNAAVWLRQRGRNAFSLQGGLDQWRALGLPVK